MPQRIHYRPSALSTSTAELRSAVDAIFAAYERQDATAFSALVSRQFRSADNSGLAYTMPFFENATREDFRNLASVSFEVIVHSATWHDDRSLCRLSITWHRRARVPFGAEEWIVRSQSSALIWRREEDTWRLWSIEGAPIFGLSDPSGAILVREGKVDGVVPAAGARIEHGQYQ